MTSVQNADSRKKILGRLIAEIANKGRAWTPDETRRMREYAVEISALESEIRGGLADKYDAAFNDYLRRGYQRMSAENLKVAAEYRTATVGVEGVAGAAYPGSSSGFFAPASFMHEVTAASMAAGPMLANCRVIDTPSATPMGFPQDEDTTISAELITEGSLVDTQDVTIKQTILGGFKVSSKIVKVSREMVEDSAFPLDAYLAEKFGIRIARLLEPKFISGAGTTEPLGLTSILSSSYTALGTSPNDGGASRPASIGTNDVAALFGYLDFSYKQNDSCAWLFHPNTLTTMRQTLNKYGSPVFWTLENTVPTLHGKKVLEAPALDQLQASPSSPVVTKNVCLFGALNRYVCRRSDAIIVRMDTRFAELGQVAYVMHHRVDANLVDGAASGNRAVVLMTTQY